VRFVGSGVPYLPAEGQIDSTGRKTALASIRLLSCRMGQSELAQRLQEVERDLERGEQSIANQRTMVQTLERGGHDARAANLFLRWLSGVQARNLKERDRLLKELGPR
jgi:hypothetical protein